MLIWDFASMGKGMALDIDELVNHPVVQMSSRYSQFIETLASESDRGCAVLALCVLEDLARDAILRRIGVFGDKMLDRLCPRGAWGVTTESLHMLGIISVHERVDLLLLIKIRNEFAHRALEDLSFDTQHVASRIDQLNLMRWYLHFPQPKSRRERFLWTAHFLHTMIANRGGNAQPLTPCDEMVVVPKGA
jgi:hypothetical protein